MRSESRTQWMDRKFRTRPVSAAEEAKRAQRRAERDAALLKPLNPGVTLTAAEVQAERDRVRCGLIRQHGSVSTGATWQRGRN
jgi:hypothetical protein